MQLLYDHRDFHCNARNQPMKLQPILQLSQYNEVTFHFLPFSFWNHPYSSYLLPSAPHHLHYHRNSHLIQNYHVNHSLINHQNYHYSPIINFDFDYYFHHLTHYFNYDFLSPLNVNYLKQVLSQKI